MGFGQAISGLSSAQKAIDVTSNNIANVGTVGFKKSRGEFGDVFASSFFGTGKTSSGQGSQTVAVTQDFGRGNLNTTGRFMDLAIDGQGFFTLSGPQGVFYTRNGQFQIDKDGFIVTNNGLNLMGSEVRETIIRNMDGSATTTYSPVNNSPNTRLRVNTTEIKAMPSDVSPMVLSVHLDSTQTSPYQKAVDPPGTVLIRTKITKNDGSAVSAGDVSSLVLRVPQSDGTNKHYAILKDKDGKTQGYYVEVDYDDVTKTSKLPAAKTGKTEAPDVAVDSAGHKFDKLESIDKAKVLSQRVTYINELGQLVVYNGSPGNGKDLSVPSTFTAATAGADGKLSNLEQATNQEIAYSAADISARNLSFDKDNPGTYNESISKKVYDSLGQELIMRQYFVRVPTATPSSFVASESTTGDGSGTWKVYTYIEDPVTNQSNLLRPKGPKDPATGQPTDPTDAFFVARYKKNGDLDKIFLMKPPTPPASPPQGPPAGYVSEKALLFLGKDTDTMAEIDDQIVAFEEYSNVKPERASQELNLRFKLEGTQSAGKFVENHFRQSGYPAGNFSSMSFNEDGVAIAKYSNGQTRAIGTLLLSTFTNEQGLANRGGNLWAETSLSGQPLVNKPNSSVTGAIRASTLEASNVDLTAELVDMIQFQANYQANAQSIRVQNTALQSVLQIT